MLRITNLTNGPIPINYYISLKPYETKDVDTPMTYTLANLRRINVLRIIEINSNNSNESSETNDSNEESTSRSRRSKKNLEIESE